MSERSLANPRRKSEKQLLSKMPRENHPKKRKLLSASEVGRLDLIKRLAIIAMFSDDELMQIFVVKGGSALDLIYKVSARASIDVDLSMPTELPCSLVEARERIARALNGTFADHNLLAFDVTLEEVPPGLTPDFKDFWGGYSIHFKIIDRTKADEIGDNIESLRRNALQIGQKGKFRVDVSKHEYCDGKVASDLRGYRIYVYSPQMIVAEKLRAICQQAPEYASTLKRGMTPRARDFVDIYVVMEHFKLNMASQENLELIRAIFDVKKVPYQLLTSIGEQRELHRADFPSVVDTVKIGTTLKKFDFYFDYVMKLAKSLEALWNV